MNEPKETDQTPHRVPMFKQNGENGALRVCEKDHHEKIT